MQFVAILGWAAFNAGGDQVALEGRLPAEPWRLHELLQIAPGIFALFVPGMFIAAVTYNITFSDVLGGHIYSVMTIQDHLSTAVRLSYLVVLVAAPILLLYTTMARFFSERKGTAMPLHLRLYEVGWPQTCFMIVALFGWELADNLILKWHFTTSGAYYGSILVLVCSSLIIGRHNSRIDEKLRICVGSYIMMLSFCLWSAAGSGKEAWTTDYPRFKLTFKDVAREGVLIRGLDKVVVVRLLDVNEIALIEWTEFKGAAFSRDNRK